jgi:hypothetical protein
MKALISEDPALGLNADEMASRLGCTLADVSRMARSGAVISISRPERSIAREYPAFQTWPEIAGEPLLKVREKLSTFEPADAVTMLAFFVSVNDLLADLTPVEVLVGRMVSARSVEPYASRLLAMSARKRLDIVLSAAGAYAADSSGW